MALPEKQKENNLPVIQLGPIELDPGVEDFETGYRGIYKKQWVFKRMVGNNHLSRC